MSTINALHKLASPFLYKFGLYQKIWRQHSEKTPYTFVVFYHRVVADNASGENDFDIESGVPASVFEKQLRFLLKHFTPVKLHRHSQLTIMLSSLLSRWMMAMKIIILSQHPS